MENKTFFQINFAISRINCNFVGEISLAGYLQEFIYLLIPVLVERRLLSKYIMAISVNWFVHTIE